MKKKLTVILALALVFAMALTLCACGGGETKKQSSNAGTMENGKQVWYLGGNNLFSADVNAKELFKDVADTVDPASIYASVEFTEEMLHGVYTLNNKEEDLASVRRTIPFEAVEFSNGTITVSVLPVAVYMGKDFINCRDTGYRYEAYTAIKDHEVAILSLATEDDVGTTPCIYEVSGNTITFKLIEQTSAEDEPFAYELSGIEFSYEFALSGPYLTLSKDKSYLKLKAYALTENTDAGLWLNGYSLPNSPLVGGLDYFSCSDSWNDAVSREGNYYDLSAYKISDDGRFTMYLQNKDLSGEVTEQIVNQYAYIIQSDASSFLTSFSIILLDGSKVCYYTDDITMREARVLEEQGVDVSGLTEEKLEEIAEKKSDLFDDLEAEFEAQGIDVTIHRATGEIALDSTVLFGVNESAVSDEGKAFLQKFMTAYTAVVFGEKYKDFVTGTMVEGHTDTSGGYDLNLELSKARAESVKEYCLSAECGVDEAYAGSLQGMMEAIGYSYDKPVYDANGEVDMDASRRVSFRFLVNVGE